MHSIVMTFRGAVVKVEVANFCAAMDTLINQDELSLHESKNRFQYLDCLSDALIMLLF